jgi:hypothetical protein
MPFPLVLSVRKFHSRAWSGGDDALTFTRPHAFHEIIELRMFLFFGGASVGDAVRLRKMLI